MRYNITKNDILNQIIKAEKTRLNSVYTDLTYEDGVIAALLWIVQDGVEESPIFEREVEK
jgi:hypothetical protein